MRRNDNKIVWPLASGVALVDGEEMMEMTKGKAIATIHCIGDELWSVES